jgi:long-chain acyl-CoA synthetase
MFWSLNSVPGVTAAATAVVLDNGQLISRHELDSRVAEAARVLSGLGERRLGLLYLSNTLPGLVAYLACLRSGQVPLLLPADLSSELAAGLQALYRPDWVIRAHGDGDPLPGSGQRLQVLAEAVVAPSYLHPDLGLLLSTSGTTGSPKLVRLSYASLQANADSIAQYLQLGAQDRALTVLPPYYSYGLSVINSHLQAGSTLVLRDVSVLSPAFAQSLREQSVTSIAGVPYTYQILHRTGFQLQDLPALRTLTQAGGRLDDRLTQTFATIAMEKGWRFFVMYGQTEATARISYVLPERLASKIGSIGLAIPGGQLSLDPDSNELVYCGPNVMMGYAMCREDLARGDELQGVLRTGDLGRQDEEGFFYVTGRLKRFVKLAGNRVGLDEVEHLLQKELSTPAVVGGRDERMVVWLETLNDAVVDSAKQLLSGRYGLHHSLYRIKTVAQLPLLSSGKKDYQALMVDA